MTNQWQSTLSVASFAAAGAATRIRRQLSGNGVVGGEDTCNFDVVILTCTAEEGCRRPRT